jgi:8-oxo-dGTP pyrophosphatase MutT (NUDIX family)
MKHFEYTHRVAVNAYLIQNHRFLLLKRNSPPYIWAPPGGRLDRDEPPLKGLRREVKEETNLDIDIVAPVNTWFGHWQKYPLIAIDFLCIVQGGDLRLSSEHNDFAWVSLKELEAGKPVKLEKGIGFSPEDFQKAKRLDDLLRGSDC